MNIMGYKDIVHNFSGYKISIAFQKEGELVRKEVLKAVMLIDSEQEEMEFKPDRGTVRHENLTKNKIIFIQNESGMTTGEQAKVSKSIEYQKKNILIVQALAETGKTYKISLYISKLLKVQLEIILVTALTNLAVQKIAENVLKQNRLRSRELIFLQLAANETMVEAHSQIQAWERCRIPEIL